MDERKRWAFLFSTEDVMDIDDPTQVYLHRRHLIRTPLFQVLFHRIKLPDGDRALHDHPWNWGSLILKGAYFEEVPGNVSVVRPRWSWKARRATDLHRVVHLCDDEVWTLVLTGRNFRQWGFMEKGVWRDAPTYLADRAQALAA